MTQARQECELYSTPKCLQCASEVWSSRLQIVVGVEGMLWGKSAKLEFTHGIACIWYENENHLYDENKKPGVAKLESVQSVPCIWYEHANHLQIVNKKPILEHCMRHPWCPRWKVGAVHISQIDCWLHLIRTWKPLWTYCSSMCGPGVQFCLVPSRFSVRTEEALVLPLSQTWQAIKIGELQDYFSTRLADTGR